MKTWNKAILLAFTVFTALTVNFTAYAFDEDNFFDANVNGANLIVRDYNDLMEDIDTRLPDAISTQEERVKEQEEEVAKLEEAYRDVDGNLPDKDSFAGIQLKEAQGRLNRYRTELDSLNEQLDVAEEQVDNIRIGIKQAQDDAFSSDINYGNSVNSDYIGIENYDENVIEYTDRFWLDGNRLYGCYKYWVDNWERWEYIPFITPWTRIALYNSDGVEVRMNYSPGYDIDYEKNYSAYCWTPASSERDVEFTDDTYILEVNGVKYYIGDRPSDAGKHRAE